MREGERYLLVVYICFLEVHSKLFHALLSICTAIIELLHRPVHGGPVVQSNFSSRICCWMTEDHGEHSSCVCVCDNNRGHKS